MEADKLRIQKSIEAALGSVRPYLQADGGDISLVDITDEMVVKVKLQGSCHNCPLSMQTLKGGVEMVIKKSVPEVVEVIAVE
ncbi:NifU family protein [Marinilabiliaceae bacterium JC017]|nr:NifU family protein [Marinilabiliaceae bacterium JC017]